MILTENLSKYYGDFLAVDRVSLEVKVGQVLALLGPNGAGKTTTLRMLTSVLRPSGGWARVAGYDVVQNSSQVRAAVGVLTEQHGLYSRMPAVEYLDFFGQIYGMAPTQRRSRVESLLVSFGLQESQHRKIAEYSKGMRQKLALARALLHDPPVLLLDEPTSAMDPESARLVRDSISALKSDKRTIVICTHNLAEAEELADQIAIIRQGKIIIQGSPSALKQRMVGKSEYRITLASPLDGLQDFPPEVEIHSQGPYWVQYRTAAPQSYNSAILRYFLEQSIPVLSLEEVTPSLEEIYLQAVASPEEGI